METTTENTTMHWDWKEARDAQDRFCKAKRMPHFAPYGGLCYNCGENIYAFPHGYTVEQAGNKLITSCPICMASYVD